MSRRHFKKERLHCAWGRYRRVSNPMQTRRQLVYWSKSGLGSYDYNARWIWEDSDNLLLMDRQIMDLESRLAQALEEVSHLAHLPPGTSKRANPEWLPRAPAKHTLAGHRGAVTAISFHPVFSNLVTASDDATMKIWDWETGEVERTLKGHTRTVTDCEFDSKGKNLGASLDKKTIYRLSCPICLSIPRLIISPTTVSCSYDLFVKLWNVDNDYQNFATLRGHEHSVSSARFLPGDDRIISASRDQTVRIWSIAST